MKNKFYQLLSITIIMLNVHPPADAQWTTSGNDIYNSNTGNVGIGTAGIPKPSAKLEIKSTTQGVLIPRMTFAQRNAIVSPVIGLLIYQTNSTPGFHYYNGTAWTAVTPQSANKTLSNLNAPTAINQNLIPQSNNSLDIGSVGKSWRNFYIGSRLYLGGALTMHTSPNAASGNFFVGNNAGNTANSGSFNTGSGQNALNSLTWGGYNTASGFTALKGNTSGAFNTAIGSEALPLNTTGDYNTAVGAQALYSNDAGQVEFGADNTAIGALSSYSNTTGEKNTAIGAFSFPLNTTGWANTACGAYAMFENESGSRNTALGGGADINNGISGSTAIGYEALATANNEIMLGSTDITSVKAAGSFVIYSDGRFKKNIQENVPGLDFIKLLHPVTFNYDIHSLNSFIAPAKQKNNLTINAKWNINANAKLKAEREGVIAAKEKKMYTGFIAQEVEAAANKLNYDFSGVYKPQNDKDPYGLSYSDFVVPLVKAVQQLSNQNDSLKSEIGNLKSEMGELKRMIVSSLSTVNNQQSTTLSSTSLEQNTPNPFTYTTTIAYILPGKFSSAKIILTDRNGKQLKQINISNPGKGTISIDASEFAAGAYNYSLYIDSKLIATKQMVLTK